VTLTLGARRLGPVALVAGAAILATAVAIGAESWRLPIIGYIERMLHDIRVGALARARPPRPDIVLATYDEDTARLTGLRSPLDRRLLAEALDRIDAAGPVAIGVDVLLDQPVDPDGDAMLMRRLMAMRTPVVLAHAAPPQLRPWQAARLEGVFAALEGGAVRRGDVRLATEADGVIRRAPAFGPPGSTFAERLAAAAGATTPARGGDAGAGR
jgi:adenylate cyclase